jgi:hypothetical protein
MQLKQAWQATQLKSLLITLRGRIRKLRQHQPSSDVPAFLVGDRTAQRFALKYKKDKYKKNKGSKMNKKELEEMVANAEEALDKLPEETFIPISNYIDFLKKLSEELDDKLSQFQPQPCGAARGSK